MDLGSHRAPPGILQHESGEKPESAEQAAARLQERHLKPKHDRKKRCKAFCRSTGRPCRALAMPSGRCRLHGGLSTGPRTPEGQQRALANLMQNR